MQNIMFGMIHTYGGFVVIKLLDDVCLEKKLIKCFTVVMIN